MPDNTPTNLSKGGGEKPKSAEELLKSGDKKNPAAEESDVNKRPLTPQDKEPQTDPTVQDAADLELEQSRGRVFGDITSSRGESNVRGLHGRDGGITGAPEGGGVHNPVASEAAINPEPIDEEDIDPVEKAKKNKDDPST